jgi:uncharacterized membrane protein HdeD (DUF308 family)
MFAAAHNLFDQALKSFDFREKKRDKALFLITFLSPEGLCGEKNRTLKFQKFTNMKRLLAKTWQTILFRGIFALLFGTIALAWPGLTLVSLIYLFAFYAIADGVSTISGAWQHRKTDGGWGLLLFMGILSLLAGILSIFFPGLTAIYLLILIGVRAIFDGILTILAAIRLRKEIDNEGWLALSGFVSIIFGIWVISRPGAGALAFIVLIAMFAVAVGIILIILALKARGWSRSIGHRADEIKSAFHK